MKYYFFIDESWDHSLIKINKDFPCFILCWILISEKEYQKLQEKIQNLKQEFFQNKNIIFHSRDIRRHEKEFKIFFDEEIKKIFFEKLNTIITETDFSIISIWVKKENYIKRYGKTAKNPYEISLSYIIERLVKIGKTDKNIDSINIFVEKRWKREDKELLQHYNRLYQVGTYYVWSSEIQNIIKRFDFRDKKENDIGIQIADLCAYPIARYVQNSEEFNQSFELVKPKIYKNTSGNMYWYWLKIVP